ncbi:unnamed protein product [Soboliphyme baturini]|uniref:Uncharacterized protein n=1 Tax=Soboliphyme baturini TaxID=241478 RepID=A0A183IHK7_9BILA|nr:unnamed protein product [Soboliphyme baturini]
MPRYLLFFSYIGTRFSGVQVQPNTFTVQGVLEVRMIAYAKYLRISINQPGILHLAASVLSFVVKANDDKALRLKISSRTDTGVHALINTAVVDLPPTASFINSDNRLCSENPPLIVAKANSLLSRISVPVRLIGCRIVSDGFCPRRHAVSRHYLYRLAVLKYGYDELCETNCEMTSYPIGEHNRCWFLPSNFDPYKFREAAAMFRGYHNFASLMNHSKDHVRAASVPTERSVFYTGIELGRPLMDSEYDLSSKCYTFYDVNIIAKSFLYKQICVFVIIIFGISASQQIA